MFARSTAFFSSLMMLLLSMGAILVVVDGDNHQDQTYLEIFNQVSACFTEDSTTDETISCLTSLTACLDESSVGTVETCILDSAADDSSEAIADACLGSYVSCIEDEAGYILDSLDPCVNATLYDLGICFIDNAETCSSTCSTDDIPPEGTFSDLTASDVATCDGIQTNIMDPTCEAIDCCAACVGKYEDLMNCIVGDVLDMKVLKPPNVGDTCTVSCSSRRRRLHHESRLNRKLAGQEPNPNDIASKCGHLFKPDDIDTTSSPAENLGNRLIQGDPLQCVIGEAIALSMQEQVYSANNGDTSDATGNKPWILKGILVSALFYSLGLN